MSKNNLALTVNGRQPATYTLFSHAVKLQTSILKENSEQVIVQKTLISNTNKAFQFATASSQRMVAKYFL